MFKSFERLSLRGNWELLPHLGEGEDEGYVVAAVIRLRYTLFSLVNNYSSENGRAITSGDNGKRISPG